MKKRQLLLFLISFLFLNTASAVDGLDMPPDRLIGVNPLGMMLGGLSWLEYETMSVPGSGMVMRGDLFAYKYDEEEGSSYSYHEDGSGFGVGFGMRSYFNGRRMNGFYGGIAADVVSVSWKWDENDYGTSYSGSGNTLALALTFQAGSKIFISDTLYIDPSLNAGYIMLLSSNEDSSGLGLLVMPALTVGMVF